MEQNTLEVQHLCVSFFTQKGEIKAVNDVSLKVPEGKIVGIVGESGCGKSMTARAVMGLVRYPGKVVGGRIVLGGCDKDIPAQLMATVSVNKPTIFLPGGAMLPGNYKGETLACGTDSYKLYNDYVAGKLTWKEMMGYAGCLYGSAGACPIMSCRG